MEKRSYPQIEGHPAQMTHEQATEYDRPVMVGHAGEVKMCIRDGYSYYEYNYMEPEGKQKGKLFCDFAEAEAIRGCSGFDF